MLHAVAGRGPLTRVAHAALPPLSPRTTVAQTELPRSRQPWPRFKLRRTATYSRERRLRSPGPPSLVARAAGRPTCLSTNLLDSSNEIRAGQRLCPLSRTSRCERHAITGRAETRSDCASTSATLQPTACGCLRVLSSKSILPLGKSSSARRQRQPAGLAQGRPVEGGAGELLDSAGPQDKPDRCLTRGCSV